MKKLLLSLGAALLAGLPLLAQRSAAQAPIASNPIVLVRGKITKVQTAAGQGMPTLEVDQGGMTTKVLLGSMRYLMQNNFNPKAGQEVEVKGYKTADLVVAISVTLVAENKTLQLRDESGWPLWQGGRRGRGTGRGPRAGAGMGPGAGCWRVAQAQGQM